MKADLKTKLIHNSRTTPASVHDSEVFEELLDDKDQAVLADSACHSAEHEAHLIKLNAQEFLMRKATRGHPLSEAEQQTNHTISRMRVRVEHIFARRAHMGADWCRSIGLKRATQHNHLSNLVLFTTWTATPAWLAKAGQIPQKPRQRRKDHLDVTHIAQN